MFRYRGAGAIIIIIFIMGPDIILGIADGGKSLLMEPRRLEQVYIAHDVQ